MQGLLLKDLYVYKKEILIFSGLILVCSVLFFIPFSLEQIEYMSILYPIGKVFFIGCIFFALGAIENGLFSEDEQIGYCQFILSAPQGGKGHVQSKYYECMFINILGAFWCLFICAVSDMLTNVMSGMEIWIMLLFFFQLFLRAVEMPFLFRFGSRYGNYYKTGIGLLVLFVILTYGLYGDISHMRTLEEFLDWFSNLSDTQLSDGSMLLCGILPMLCLIFYYVSYLFSCRAYTKMSQNL